MSHSERVPRAARVMRWVARIWRGLITVAALIMVFTPDPYATEPISLRDGFLLSLWGVAILGLLLAWRWEVVGGIVTIATMVVRELAWVVLYGDWLVNFLIMWVVVVADPSTYRLTSTPTLLSSPRRALRPRAHSPSLSA